MQHKHLIESKNLGSKAEQLVQFLSDIDNAELIDIPTSGRRQFRTWTPDSQVNIRGDNRFLAQKRYRQQAKRQLLKALNNLNDDVVVEDIAYCQPWDWRW